MTISQKDVAKIAHLARLYIPTEELDDLARDLDNILSLVAQMDDQDTTSILPLAHPLEEHQPLRADQVTETNQRDLFQSIAPQVSAGLYIVPKVIDIEME